MRFRPCIDIHNGKVKQIVGSSLSDEGDSAKENFVAGQGADYYAALYKDMGLSGGHVILLNSKESPEYEETLQAGLSALKTAPGFLQIGGGITAENAAGFLDAGASHVIVTSYVFKNGKVNYANLEKLITEVGKERIVLDLSCKASASKTFSGGLEHDENNRVPDSYYIVTDRWQKMTDVILCERILDELSAYCDEFLVHAADVEGKQNGIEEGVVSLLGKWHGLPVTYAGGIHTIDEIYRLKKLGGNNLDFTIGSALSLFGGSLSLEEVMRVVRSDDEEWS